VHEDQQIAHGSPEKFDFVEREDMKSKPPVLVQSHSISPKQSTLVASSKEVTTEDAMISPQHNKADAEHAKSQEIAHYVHQTEQNDTSESDTDVDDNNSLNALSSDDDDDDGTNSPNNQDADKQWI